MIKTCLGLALEQTLDLIFENGRFPNATPGAFPEKRKRIGSYVAIPVGYLSENAWTKEQQAQIDNSGLTPLQLGFEEPKASCQSGATVFLKVWVNRWSVGYGLTDDSWALFSEDIVELHAPQEFSRLPPWCSSDR